MVGGPWHDRRPRTPPVALAGRLFALDVDSEWDILNDAPSRYADVLGEAGLAELKRLAEEYELQVDPDALIEELSVGHQQRVEILKAEIQRTEAAAKAKLQKKSDADALFSFGKTQT